MAEEKRLQLNVGTVEVRDDLLYPFYHIDNRYADVSWIEDRGSNLIQRDNVISAVTITLNPEFNELQLRTNNDLFTALAATAAVGIILYFVLGCIVCVCVTRQFENYLVSELYAAKEDELIGKQDMGGEDSDANEESGCCGCGSSKSTRLRGYTSASFHNEIFGKDEEILNTSEVSCFKRWCCCLMTCGRKRSIETIFNKARRSIAQELNVTSIIKAQRQGDAICKIIRKD